MGDWKQPWSAKRGKTLEEDLDLLIGDLCVHWGFCNQLAGEDLLRSGEALQAEGFAVAVLRAEGMDPDMEVRWRRDIRRAFVERYGQEEVSAGSYRMNPLI